MNMSYWDGGYVLLDVTDPRPGQVTLIAESDFALLDEEQLARGNEIAPEGNAHQSELSANRKYLIATDEDFNPFARHRHHRRPGRTPGSEYRANSANATPPIDEGTEITGRPHVRRTRLRHDHPRLGATGHRRRPRRAGRLHLPGEAGQHHRRRLQRRDRVQRRPARLPGRRHDGRQGTIPFVFVNRDVGLRLLDQTIGADVCTQPRRQRAPPTATTTIAVGVRRLGLRADVPHRRPQAAGPNRVDPPDRHLRHPRSPRPGVRHGVRRPVGPRGRPRPRHALAYFSYYAGGFRVVSYDHDRLEEVGAFIDEGGNNFWGVEIWHDENGEKFVLASDRDFGLYIFQYTGR